MTSHGHEVDTYCLYDYDNSTLFVSYYFVLFYFVFLIVEFNKRIRRNMNLSVAHRVSNFRLEKLNHFILYMPSMYNIIDSVIVRVQYRVLTVLCCNKS